ncbi:MAG: LysE family transporter [Oscillospiraceae bacterium]|nr:LysE family transporter [Oscillospiraceae bacterium]
MKTLINGLLTGLFLQLAIGPIFFFILSIAVESDLIVAWAGVLGVVLADYIYVALSILGIAKLIDHPKVKHTFAIISALVIVAFGAYLLWGAIRGAQGTVVSGERTMTGAFVSSFFLTISSPLTLFFWSSVFAVKAIEKNYNKNEITIFGIGAGLSTVLFLGTTVTIVSMLHTSLPEAVVAISNILVAAIMIGYGLIRLVKIFANKQAKIAEEY